MTTDDERSSEPVAANGADGASADRDGAATASATRDDVPGEAAADGLGASEPAEEDLALGDLLRGALLREEPAVPDVLRGVQRKIRRRSGGKFFSDGWSTERQPPTQTYLVTSLIMLGIVIAIWAVLYPVSGTTRTVEPPAPVNVIPPP
jgi:hypothetical protein